MIQPRFCGRRRRLFALVVEKGKSSIPPFSAKLNGNTSLVPQRSNSIGEGTNLPKAQIDSRRLRVQLVSRHQAERLAHQGCFQGKFGNGWKTAGVTPV